jgi:DNA-binding transcriptional ArsR family regulator
MTKRQSLEENPEDVIDRVLGQQEWISTSDVVRETGLTRQAVLYHLNKMLASGRLVREGRRRGTRYRRGVAFSKRYRLEGLQEDEVWKEVVSSVPLAPTGSPAHAIESYAFNEMLNNAIEHSRGTEARVAMWSTDGQEWFEVADDGVGVFETVKEKTGLSDELAVIQELAKGKQTTDPDRHTGEGIFFTSKAVDIFQIESGGTRWIVDNLRADQAVGSVPRVRGSRVRWAVDRDITRDLKAVFDLYSDRETFAFTKTSVAVRLFEPGGSFVSRSEARRVAARLEGFEEVEIDFSGVTQIGQAFADELFRVWAMAHPGTRLRPTNMNPYIEAMISRATVAS